MSTLFEMGWNSYEFYFESKFVDLYITNQLMILGAVVLAGLFARKIIKKYRGTTNE